VSNGNADGISYNIVNYDDGTDTGVDLTVSYDLGTWSLNQQRNAAAQIPSTGDANALFSGYILDDGLISFSAGSGDPVATITFSHLQAGTSYDVALLMNRSYDAGETQYQLQGISSSDNISSTGAHIIDSATTGLNAFNGGNGYVARWENIIPSGSTFSIVVSEVDAAQYIFLPQAIRIVATAAPPTITFTSWADGFSVTASENDDSDGDGISNLLEYALDLNPTAQDSSSLPSVETENDSGTDYLTLRYRRNLNAPDLTYTIVSSTDLSTWHAATVESDTVDTADPDGDGSSEIRKVRVAFSEAENGKLFLRLKVETR
jgi:hypothetical protein